MVRGRRSHDDAGGGGRHVRRRPTDGPGDDQRHPRHPHTGVYEGRNDASAAYLSILRAGDPNGRDCRDDEPEPTPAVDADERDRDQPRDVPAPPRAPSGSSNTGDSGHPCLPGERDGDGDGWCGES